MVSTGWSSEWPGLWRLKMQTMYEYWMCRSIGDSYKDQLRLSVINTQCYRKQCHSLTHISRSPFLFSWKALLSPPQCRATTPWSLRKAGAGTLSSAPAASAGAAAARPRGRTQQCPTHGTAPPPGPTRCTSTEGSDLLVVEWARAVEGEGLAQVRGCWCWRGRRRWCWSRRCGRWWWRGCWCRR